MKSSCYPGHAEVGGATLIVSKVSRSSERGTLPLRSQSVCHPPPTAPRLGESSWGPGRVEIAYQKTGLRERGTYRQAAAFFFFGGAPFRCRLPRGVLSLKHQHNFNFDLQKATSSGRSIFFVFFLCEPHLPFCLSASLPTRGDTIVTAILNTPWGCGVVDAEVAHCRS